MKPTKPDRWERLINKENTFQAHNMEVLSVKRVINLLRKERSAVVRIVKNVLNESIVRDLPETGPGYQCACRHILDQLKRRAQ